MYLIKNIHFTNFGKAVMVEDGILVTKHGNKLVTFYPFWGEDDIVIDTYADISKLGSTDNENAFLLSYVSDFSDSDYYVKDIVDGFKKIIFHVSTYQPDKIEGYIIFIERIVGSINTNGKKIFGRYPNEIVAILEEGNYLEFEGRKIEVINGKLLLYI